MIRAQIISEADTYARPFLICRHHFVCDVGIHVAEKVVVIMRLLFVLRSHPFMFQKLLRTITPKCLAENIAFTVSNA